MKRVLAVGSVENNRRRGQKKSVPQTKRTGDDGKETDNKGLAAGKDVNFNSVYGSRSTSTGLCQAQSQSGTQD